MHFSKKLTIVSVAAAFLALSAGSALASQATGSVNVRTGPGVGFQRVDTLYPGEVVAVQGCQYGWCYINHRGPDGWVSANYLRRGVGYSNSPQPSVRFQFGFGSGGSSFGFSFGTPRPSPWPYPRYHHHNYYDW